RCEAHEVLHAAGPRAVHEMLNENERSAAAARQIRGVRTVVVNVNGDRIAKRTAAMHGRSDGDVVAARRRRRAPCGVGRLEIRGRRGAGAARRGEETKRNTNNETTHTTSSLFVGDESPNCAGTNFVI